MDTHALAWAAGFFDGEGTTFRNRSNNGIHLSIHQVYKPSLERFRHAIGFGTILGPYHKGNQPIWLYQVSNFQQVQAAVALLWCWLGDEKKRQAKQALIAHLTRPRKVARSGAITPSMLLSVQGLAPKEASQLLGVKKSTLYLARNPEKRRAYWATQKRKHRLANL
jgi:hypothetical protein